MDNGSALDQVRNFINNTAQSAENTVGKFASNVGNDASSFVQNAYNYLNTPRDNIASNSAPLNLQPYTSQFSNDINQGVQSLGQLGLAANVGNPLGGGTPQTFQKQTGQNLGQFDPIKAAQFATKALLEVYGGATKPLAASAVGLGSGILQGAGNVISGKPITQNVPQAIGSGAAFGAQMNPINEVMGGLPILGQLENKVGQIASQLPLLNKAPQLAETVGKSVAQAVTGGTALGAATGQNIPQTIGQFAPYTIGGALGGKYIVSPIAKAIVDKFGSDAYSFLANKDLIQRVVTGQGSVEDQKQFDILNQTGLTSQAARTPGGLSVTQETPKQGKIWDMLRSMYPTHFDTQGNPISDFTDAQKTPLNQLPSLEKSIDKDTLQKDLAASQSNQGGQNPTGQSVNPQELTQAYNEASQNKPMIDQLIANIGQSTGTEVADRMKQPASAINSMEAKGKTPDQMNDLVGVNFTGKPDTLNNAMQQFEDLQKQGVLQVTKKEHISNPDTGYTGEHWDFQLAGSDQHYEAQFTTPEERAIQITTHGDYKSAQALAGKTDGKVSIPIETQVAGKVIRDTNPNINPISGLVDKITEQPLRDIFFAMEAPKSTDYGNPADTQKVDQALIDHANEVAKNLDQYLTSKFKDNPLGQDAVVDALAKDNPSNLNIDEKAVYDQLAVIKQAIVDKLGTYDPNLSLSEQVKNAMLNDVNNKPIVPSDLDTNSKQSLSKIGGQLGRLRAQIKKTASDDPNLANLKEQENNLKSQYKNLKQLPKDQTKLKDNNTAPISTKKNGAGLMVFARTRELIRIQSPAGQTLAQNLQDARNLGMQLAGTWKTLMPTVFDLDNKEFNNFIDVAEGKAEAINDKVTQAFGEWDAVRNDIADKAKAVDAFIGFRDNYFPHKFPPGTFIPGSSDYNRAINDLIKNGIAKNESEAVKILGRMESVVRNRRQGNLEVSREGNALDFRRTKGALLDYLDQAGNRIAQVQILGKGDTKAMQLIANIAKEGGDAKLAKDAFDTAVGAKGYNEQLQQLSSFVRSFNSATQLTFSALAHASQLSNTATVTGALRTLAALKGITDPEQQRFIGMTGVTLDNALRDFREGTGLSGVVGKVTAPLFNEMQRFNRSVTVVAGRYFAIDMGKSAAEGNNGAIDALRQMGLDATAIVSRGGQLTEDEQIKAAQNIVERTQFYADAQDLPMWANHPLGKLVAQFRQFAYNQTAFTWREVIQPALKGNLVPLITFAATAIPLGYLLYGKLGNLLRFKQGQDNNGKDWVTSAARATGIGEVVQNFQPYSSTETADQGILQGIGQVFGPTASTAIETAQNISRLQQGNPAPLEKQAISRIPLVGQQIKNMIFPPYVASADTQKYLDAKAQATQSLSGQSDNKALTQFNYFTTSQVKGGPDSTQKNEMLIKALTSKDPTDQKFVDAVYNMEHTADPNNPLWGQSEQFVKDYTAWRVATVTGKSGNAAELALKYDNTSTPLPTIQRQYEEYAVKKQQDSYNQQQATINQPGLLGGLLPNSYQIQQSLGAAPPLNATPPAPLSPMTPIQQTEAANPQLAAAAHAYTAANASGNVAEKRAILAQNPGLKAYWDQNSAFYQNNPSTAPVSPLDQYLQSVGITPTPNGSNGNNSSNSGRGSGSYRSSYMRKMQNPAAYNLLKIGRNPVRVAKYGAKSKGKTGVKMTSSKSPTFKPLSARVGKIGGRIALRSPQSRMKGFSPQRPPIMLGRTAVRGAFA